MEYLVKHYMGRLHTGKGLNDVWSSDEVIRRYRYSIEKYQQKVKEFDPFRVFSSQLGSALGLEWPKKGRKFSDYYYKK